MVVSKLSSSSKSREQRGHLLEACTFSRDFLKNDCDPLMVEMFLYFFATVWINEEWEWDMNYSFVSSMSSSTFSTISSNVPSLSPHTSDTSAWSSALRDKE